MSEYDGFDMQVVIRPLLRPATNDDGADYGDPRTVRARIETGIAAEGSGESDLPQGRIYLATAEPPGPQDVLTLPAPFKRHPTITSVDPVVRNGHVHHVVVSFR